MNVRAATRASSGTGPSLRTQAISPMRRVRSSSAVIVLLHEASANESQKPYDIQTQFVRTSSVDTPRQCPVAPVPALAPPRPVQNEGKKRPSSSDLHGARTTHLRRTSTVRRCGLGSLGFEAHRAASEAPAWRTQAIPAEGQNRVPCSCHDATKTTPRVATSRSPTQSGPTRTSRSLLPLDGPTMLRFSMASTIFAARL